MSTIVVQLLSSLNILQYFARKELLSKCCYLSPEKREVKKKNKMHWRPRAIFSKLSASMRNKKSPYLLSGLGPSVYVIFSIKNDGLAKSWPIRLGLMTATFLIGSEPRELHLGFSLILITTSNSRFKSRKYR